MLARDKQTSLRMPSELLQRLQETARGNGRPVGAEICARLEASFDTATEAPDQITGDLLTAIRRASSFLQIDGDWHKDPFVFAVFKATVSRLLDHWKPQGDPVFNPPPPGEANALLGSDMSPDAAARMLTAFALNQDY